MIRESFIFQSQKIMLQMHSVAQRLTSMNLKSMSQTLIMRKFLIPNQKLKKSCESLKHDSEDDDEEVIGQGSLNRESIATL